MEPLTPTPAWQALCAHRAELGEAHLRELFAADPGRCERFSLSAAGLFLDYSKNRRGPAGSQHAGDPGAPGGVWYRGFFGATSLCIAPYAQALARLPAYLQQLEMESNGKSVTRDGAPVDTPTCPVIWGEPGTNGQHAFFHLLHQGTDLIPVDFIAPLQASHNLPGHHRLLLANCIAQSKALMVGKCAEEVRAELAAQGLAGAALEAQIPHRVFPGNRPSNTLLLPELSPQALGALVALYEHKVFVQGVIWGVNSFDQWGVELGKQIARGIAEELAGGAAGEHDASTRGLIALARGTS